MGTTSSFNSDVPVTPDVIGGYAVIHIEWPSAASLGPQLVELARSHGLTVYLPFASQDSESVIVCPSDELPDSQYWSMVQVYADGEPEFEVDDWVRHLGGEEPDL
jgi:hypothetical protein